MALSITMTAVSTPASGISTPRLTLLYAGHVVDVAASSRMLLDVLKLVIAPVCGGRLTRIWLGRRLEAVTEVFALISVLAIVLDIGIVVALDRARSGDVAAVVVLAVALHSLLGLASGYGIARLAGLDAGSRRTLAIGVGMQTPGLAARYLRPVAALPGALFSIWHEITGSALATHRSRWRS